MAWWHRARILLNQLSKCLNCLVARLDQPLCWILLTIVTPLTVSVPKGPSLDNFFSLPIISKRSHWLLSYFWIYKTTGTIADLCPNNGISVASGPPSRRDLWRPWPKLPVFSNFCHIQLNSGKSLQADYASDRTRRNNWWTLISPSPFYS